MKTSRFWPLLLLAVGCAAPKEVTVKSPEDEAPKLTSIEFDRTIPIENDLSLLRGNSRLAIGVSLDRAREVFDPPSKSTPFSSIPSTFGPNFSATGWDLDTYSFGCIAYTNENPGVGQDPVTDAIVFAMVIQEDVNQDTVDEALRLYSLNFGLPEDDPQNKLRGGGVDYWFWNRPGRRLMIATAIDPKGRKSLTISLGVPTVMTHLRMSPERAAEDRREALEALAKAKDG